MVNHIFSRAAFKGSVLESHDTISDQDTLKIDGSSSCTVVELINFNSQVGNIFACI